MYTEKNILVGKSGENNVYLYTKMANRHGLIAGATGTGKTTTLRVIAESFSDCGVPVFLADVKGDIASMCKSGSAEGFVGKKVQEMNLEAQGFKLHGCPVAFWDVYAKKGMPLRTTVSEMGPILLSRILGLNATQESVLTVVFKIADDEGLLLIDTKDLKSMLQYVSEKSKEYSLKYGNMSTQSIATIIRSVVALESEGGESFIGEPAVSISDWICRTCDGQGIVNIFDCQELIQKPMMYSTFMLWMLSELFENLPEIGDPEKPRIVFFFDEAHLLFDNASKALIEKIEQIVKLIRSKGVGIFFITQSPSDIPDGVLAQLGNKFQHALHAYTPSEQKAVKSAAMAFRENPEFDTYETLTNLGIGEALISCLDEDGVPGVTQNCQILPPQCGQGSISDEERDALIKQNDLYLKYSESVDRDSAYEFLQRRSATAEEEKQQLAEAKEEEKAKTKTEQLQEKLAAEKKKQANKIVKNVMSTTGSTIGRQLGRSIGSAGGTFGKQLGGNIGASLGRGILGTLFGK